MHVKLASWLRPRPSRYETSIQRETDKRYSPEILWLLSRIPVPSVWPRYQVLNGDFPCSYNWQAMFKSLTDKPPVNESLSCLSDMCQFLSWGFRPGSENYNTDVQKMLCAWAATERDFFFQTFDLTLIESRTELAQLYVHTLLNPATRSPVLQLDRMRARALVMLLQHVNATLSQIHGTLDDPVVLWHTMGPRHVENIVHLLQVLPVYNSGPVLELIRTVQAKLSAVAPCVRAYGDDIAQQARNLNSYLHVIDLRGLVDISSLPKASSCIM